MKKKIIFLIFVVIASVFIFSFYNKPSENVNTAFPPPPETDNFLIGCINSSTLINQYYDELGINFTHAYVDTEDPAPFPKDPNRHTPSCRWWGTQQSDWEYLYDAVPVDKIHTKLETIHSQQHKYGRVLWQRPKIEWLAYGQSSIYECESSHINPDLWFYAFNDHYGSTEQDFQHGEGHWVLKCSDIELGSNPGFAVKRLKANTEQCTRIIGNIDPDEQINHWAGDSECDWYVKPRIRIPVSVVNNYPETEVCIVYVKEQNGTSNKLGTPVTIKAKHFRDNSDEYDGRYLEEFYFDYPAQNPPYPIKFTGDLGDLRGYVSRGTRTLQQEQDEWFNKADIKIWWSGNCDMWLDYVKVENDVADRLLGTPPDPDFDQWIEDEVSAIMTSSTPDAVYAFYIELFEFNNLPCMAYVNQKIRAYSNHTMGLTYDLLCNYQIHMPSNKRGEIVTTQKLKRMWFDRLNPLQIFLGDPYPLTATYPDGCFGPHHEQYCQRPITLEQLWVPPNTDFLIGTPTSPETYDRWLQGILDTLSHFEGSNAPEYSPHKVPYQLPGSFMFLMKHGHEISKECNIPFIAMLQAHQWMKEFEVDREPTNEELNLFTNLAISYGARGIIYWEYISCGVNTRCDNGFGFIKPEPQGLTPRVQNVYGQPKWDTANSIFDRIQNNWGTHLMSFTNADRQSYIYRSEREDLINNTYFHDLYTYKIGFPPIDCLQDFPEGDNPPPGSIGDCKQFRFLQVALFKKPPTVQNELYFMIVNRRCSPFVNNQSEDYNGGRRFIRVKFDYNHPDMTGFDNWKIINLEDNSTVTTFVKSQMQVLDLGWFMPGEGRLYKMVPTAKSGGTLLADEIIESGEEFTCEDTVWTNGYNLIIEDGVTIHFSDSAKFVVEGGTFQMGNPQHSGPNTINMDAAPGNSWKGFEFNNATVKIYGVNFSGLANDSIAMLNMIDCPLIDLRNNSFSLGTGNNKSTIDISYVNQMVYISNAYLGSNTFTGSQTQLPFVKVMAYSGFTTPVIIENNSFTGASTALFLNNIQGGAIKSNSFSGFGRAITTLTSSLDVYDNTITSTGAYGLEALSGTELKMSYAGGLLVGGKNQITNSDSSSYNIYLENSYFLMNDGENIFDVGYGGYHLYGWFPDSYSGTYEETENCFKIAGSVVDPPEHYVTLGEQGNQITNFVFTPYLTGCIQEGGEGMMVINLGDGIYDTVGILGQGGSYSSNYVITPKSIYDSISISMRFRNYANVKSLCLQLLNSYPDSIQSLGALSKLYLAVSKTDTTAQGITDLKTLYENLILNHQSNISLVKRCNYYVQKCKVLLKQYSSALAGFQQIINQNPASYEGLVARWDYMATSLLMQGQGGSERETSKVKSEKNIIPLWGGVDVPMDIGTDGVGQDDDRSPFTREERKQIRSAVNTALDISYTIEKKREEVLTELSTRGDVTATRQLKVLRSLEQTVKVEKPKNISEHLKIVTGDIQKVFVNPNAGKNTNTVFIPQEYRLSQNYPNPFNPMTKISYDIPKNSMVKLIIYDILGREVKRLVNNEFKQPGRYIVEFNGTNLASGVYFYRLETGDFVQSKKMVLVK